MVVFPAPGLATRPRMPILASAASAGMGLLAIAVAVGWLNAGFSATSAAICAATLMLFSPVMEYALGRMVFVFSLMLCALIGTALPLVLLQARPEGIGWAPMAMCVMVGMFIGMFRLWRVRPWFFFAGGLSQINIPATLAAILWTLAITVLALTSIGFTQGGLTLELVGVVCGVLIGSAMHGLSLIQPGMVSRDYINRQMQNALQQCESLIERHKLGPARRLLKRLELMSDSNPAVVEMRYTVWKFNPTHAEFHRAATDYLDRPDTDPRTNEVVYEKYKDYLAVTQVRPELPVGLHLQLARRFARMRHIDLAANIVNVHLQRDVRAEGLPEALLTLAEGYVLAERQNKAARYADTLLALYPESAQAVSAHMMLENLSAGAK